MLSNSPFLNVRTFAALSICDVMLSARITYNIAVLVFRERLQRWSLGSNERQNELLWDIPM